MSVDPDALDAALSGIASTGATGSSASLVAGTLDGLGHLLLTDRRLGVSDTSGEALRFSLPNSAVATVTRAPRPTKRGRVEIRFADGSAVYPVFGLLMTGAARRFERAWATRQPQS